MTTSKERCPNSKPCGRGCISNDKECRQDLTPAQAAAVDRMSQEIIKGGLEGRAAMQAEGRINELAFGQALADSFRVGFDTKGFTQGDAMDDILLTGSKISPARLNEKVNAGIAMAEQTRKYLRKEKGITDDDIAGVSWAAYDHDVGVADVVLTLKNGSRMGLSLKATSGSQANFIMKNRGTGSLREEFGSESKIGRAMIEASSRFAVTHNLPENADKRKEAIRARPELVEQAKREAWTAFREERDNLVRFLESDPDRKADRLARSFTDEGDAPIPTLKVMSTRRGVIIKDLEQNELANRLRAEGRNLQLVPYGKAGGLMVLAADGTRLFSLVPKFSSQPFASPGLWLAMN